MNGLRVIQLVFLMFLGFSFYNPAEASSILPLDRQETFTLLKDAYKAQIKVAETYYTYGEVREILSPYFHDKYTDLFLEENLVKEEAGYTIYGTDFPIYYIPFYSYDYQTKVIYDKHENKMYVYEYKDAIEEGPVHHKGRYEIISVENNGSDWIITEYMSSETKPDYIDKIENEQSKNDSKEQKLTAPWLKVLIWNPYKITFFL